MLSLASNAQEVELDYVIGAGYVHLGFGQGTVDGDMRSGLQVSFGALGIVENLMVNFDLGAMVTTKSEPSGFSRDSGGRCRASNGQFANDERCNNLTLLPFGFLEAGYPLKLGTADLYVAGGYHFGPGYGPHITTGLTFWNERMVSLKPISIRARLGARFFDVGLVWIGAVNRQAR
ncbi:MAG: hypothetical protein AAFV01_09290 [Bacteroidota bacterium]